MSELQPVTTPPHVGVDDQRAASRFGREPDTDYALVWFQPGEELLLEVQNESLGGLAVATNDPAPYTVGNSLMVVYHGSVLRGEVRHVLPRPDGSYLVGLRCQP